MSTAERELNAAIEILPGRLYWVALSGNPPHTQGKSFFNIDNDLIYWNFFLDFGPLNLGHLYRYCALLNNKLSEPKLKDRIIYHSCGTHPHKRTNAAFLIAAWSILECGFFDFNKFNIEEYEHFEQVENGDLNWTLANKFIAFAGPHATRESHPGGYTSLVPEDYVPYFKRKNVKLVVRLNKKYYDARKFTSQGIDHMELYFLDGSNPPDVLLARFLERVENCDGAVAVHCKAGLGRTGCVVGCYMMKHYKCTAEEVIGWLRIVRPGTIIGPQQQWLKEMNSRMWREGDLWRSKRGLAGSNANVGKGDVYANEALTRQKGSGGTGMGRTGMGRPEVGIGSDRSDGGLSRSLQGMQVSGSNGISNGSTAKMQAAEKAEEDRATTQGDYLRQRRMLAAQELQQAGNKKPVSNYKEDAGFKGGGAGAGGRDSGAGEVRFGRFFNSFSGK
eukprot:GSChrysophyteH2.ASY1.ANO1.128.1 assembled CDS